MTVVAPDRLLMSPVISSRVGDVFKRFHDAVGQETMEAAYGWERPPSCARDGETVHEHFSVGHPGEEDYSLVGWSSLIKDPRVGHLQWLALGIWPGHAGRGYRREILRTVSDWAFWSNGAEAVKVEIFHSNAGQLEKYFKDAREGGIFRHAGSEWFPDGVSTFTRAKPSACWCGKDCDHAAMTQPVDDVGGPR